ncbi:MAG: class IIb bacteriocin, lactobin A/cerein 7B family [Porphyromonadaceae bacterium]|nr:class IIb bacteriocin, lactobin A/cerein 7B family [Porphyromonadaceae bacterium]
MRKNEFNELNAQELESVNGGWLTILKFEDGHLYFLGFKLF